MQPHHPPYSFKKIAALMIAPLALVASFYAAKLYIEKPVTGTSPKAGVVVKNPDGTRTLVDGPAIRISDESVCKNGTNGAHYRFWRMSDGSVEGAITEKDSDKPARAVGTYKITKDGVTKMTLNNRLSGESHYEITLGSDGKMHVKPIAPSLGARLLNHVLPQDTTEEVKGYAARANILRQNLLAGSPATACGK